jgi:hypothetical protein
MNFSTPAYPNYHRQIPQKFLCAFNLIEKVETDYMTLSSLLGLFFTIHYETDGGAF